MNRILTVTLIASFSSAAALAQNAQNPFSADAKQSYTGIKNTLLKAAEKMPEENYSFRTTPQVRTYGEMIGHIADVQMMLCGMPKGSKSRESPTAKLRRRT